jgi:branched-chain amino acid transport system ATP-binding protein
MLDVKDIHTYYGDSYILQGVSLSVSEGQVVALMGRNGVGKTTTIRSVAGLTPPRMGSIVFKGREISHLPAYSIAHMGMGLVPQGRRIFGSLSVLEHLTVFSGKDKERRKDWTLERVLSLFPPLRNRTKQKGGTLSGGEQQMLAIGRTLVTNPELLLMDEPTEGLSPLFVKEVGRAIQSLKKEGKLSILLVEQNLAIGLKLADYMYIMNKGVIVFEGLSEGLLNRPDIQSTYLGV